MKQINRPKLTNKTRKFLLKRARAVRSAADPTSEVKRLWRLQENHAFLEIRTVLQSIATGLARCMYCEDSEGVAIDHFWPKSEYPRRAFRWENYLLACQHCNSNYKRDQFPLSQGKPLLINPTAEDPRQHLVLSPTTGQYNFTSEKGRITRDVFGLQRGNLARGRRNAWVSLEALLIDYEACSLAGHLSRAAEIETAVRQYPFASVFAEMLYIAAGPGASIIEARCLAVLQSRPEILSWI